MPVNLVQYRWTAGACNNREIISCNRSNLYSGINLQQFLPVHLLLSSIKFLFEKIILDLLSVFVNSIQFNTLYFASVLCNILYLTSVTVYLTSVTVYVLNVLIYVLYFYHIWLYFITIKQKGDAEKHCTSVRLLSKFSYISLEPE